MKVIENHEFRRENICVYYVDGFDVFYFEDEDILQIKHNTEKYFRAVSSFETITDVIKAIIIEFNGEHKKRVIYEIGDYPSGFFTQLVGNEDVCSLFVEQYSEDDKRVLELIASDE